MEKALFIFAAFLVLLLIGIFYYKVLHVKAEEGIALAALTVPIVLYVTGYVKHADYGMWLLTAMAAVGFFSIFLAGAKKEKGKEFLSFFTPSVLLFCILSGGTYIAFRHALISNFDELTQWGKAVDYMLETNSLPIGGSFEGNSTMFNSTTLFQYFISFFAFDHFQTATAGMYYTGNVIFWLAAVILPLSSRNWKQCFGTCMAVVTIFIAVNFLYVHPYYNLYSDQPVALWAGAFITWYLYTPSAKGRTVKIMTPIMLLNIIFMKTMVGPLFAVICVMVILLEYLVKKEVTFYGTLNRVISKKGLLIIGGVIIFAGLVLFTLTASGNSFFVDRLLKIDTTGDRVSKTLHSGIENIFLPVNEGEEFYNLSYVEYFVIVAVLVFILQKFILDEAQRKKTRVVYICYLVGFVLYFGILMYAFLTVFEYADSVRTGSINRYFSAYMLLGLMPVVYPLYFKENDEKEKRQVVKYIVSSVLFISLIVTNITTFPKDFDSDFNQERSYLKRKDFVGYKQQIDKITKQNGKIYFINQSRKSYYTVIADYDFKKQITRAGMCYYFPQNPEEIQGINVLEYHSIEEFPSLLASGGYSYIWIYHKNHFFKENFARIFNLDKSTVKNGNIYRVNIKENGTVKLKLLDQIKQKKR